MKVPVVRPVPRMDSFAMVQSIPYRGVFRNGAGRAKSPRHAAWQGSPGGQSLHRAAKVDVVRLLRGRCSVRVSGACVAGKRLNFTGMPERDIGMGLAADFNSFSVPNEKIWKCHLAGPLQWKMIRLGGCVAGRCHHDCSHIDCSHMRPIYRRHVCSHAVACCDARLTRIIYQGTFKKTLLR